MNAQSRIKPPDTTLASAMAAAFAEIEGATKSANNPHFKTKYADITAVIEAIKPALIAHGLFFTQHPRPAEGGVCIETVLHHAGGEQMSLGALFVPANKQDAQGFGSALTYARRYALVTAFGVPVEDDDGNAAAKSPPRQEAKPQPPITDEQAVKLMSLLKATGVAPAQFCQIMGCENVAALPAAKFEEAETRLNERLAKLAKAETNAKAQETVDA